MGDVPHCLRNSFMLAFRAQAQNHFQTRTGTHRPYWAESLKGIQRIALLQPFECNAVHHAQGMRGGFKGQPFLAATCFQGCEVTVREALWHGDAHPGLASCSQQGDSGSQQCSLKPGGGGNKCTAWLSACWPETRHSVNTLLWQLWSWKLLQNRGI